MLETSVDHQREVLLRFLLLDPPQLLRSSSCHREIMFRSTWNRIPAHLWIILLLACQVVKFFTR